MAWRPIQCGLSSIFVSPGSESGVSAPLSHSQTYSASAQSDRFLGLILNEVRRKEVAATEDRLTDAAETGCC